MTLFLVLTLLAESGKALEGRPMALSAEGYIFMTTPSGVYRFDKNALEWSVLTVKNGLPQNLVTTLGVDEGLLWVGTDSGLAVADLKLLNFRVVDTSTIGGIGFDADYVYAGGPAGILRYDKYKDQLELFETGAAVRDLVLVEDRIFAATDSGLVVFNTRYEKTEATPYEISEPLKHIVTTNFSLFFLGNQNCYQYHKTTRGWRRFDGFKANDYAVRGDSVWVATDDEVMIYDDVLGGWSRYRQEEWLPAPRITALSVTAGYLVFGSEQGIIVVDNKNRTWKKYNLANGLVEESVLRIVEEGGEIYLLSPGWLQRFDRKGDWKRLKIEGLQVAKEGLFTVDEAGGHINLSNDVKATLQGRISGQYEMQDTMVLKSETIDSRFMLGRTGGRLLAAYYDDTEKQRKLYGAVYQDPKGIVARASAGKLRSEFYKSGLIPPGSYLGGSGRLETKVAALTMAGGAKRSAFTADYFTGNSTNRLLSIEDIAYLKNVFFAVDTIDPQIDFESESLFVDNRVALDNDENTRLGQRIAGLVGDFDPRHRGIDYAVDYARGMIRFLTPLADSAVVVIKFSGGQEAVLQGRGQDSLELKNHYQLGAIEILPRSLSIRIFDTTNVEYPLDRFGLDNNRDGAVDDEYVNYFNGILRFPARRPFPDTVYQSTPASCYRMMISYRSKMSTYQLSQAPVVTNSEEVILDGVSVRRGIDYIIDYSTGNVVFLEKGRVLTKSEIEVRYEYEYPEGGTSSDTAVLGGQLAVAPGGGFEFVPGFYRSGEQQVANVVSEWELKRPALGLRLVPEIGINADDSRAKGGRVSAFGSLRRLRLNSIVETYEPAFKAFGRRTSRYGELTSRYYLYSKYEFSDFVAVDGSYDRRQAEDTVAGSQFDRETGVGGVYFNLPSLPVLTLGGGQRTYSGDLPQPQEKRYSGHASIDYSVPPGVARRARLSNLKLGGSFSAEMITEPGEMDLWEENRILSASSTLPLSNDIGVYYRGVDEREVGTSLPLEKGDNFRLTSRHDFIPGIYVANSYELDDGLALAQEDRLLSLDHSLLSMAKIGPGAWFPDLSFINFEVSYGRSMTASVSGPGLSRVFFSLMIPEQGDILYQGLSNSYTFTADLRPASSLIISPAYSLARGETGYWDGLTRFVEHNLSPKLETYLGPNTTLTGQYFLKDEERAGISSRVSNNPVAEWQNRWSRTIRTKTRLSVRREVYNEGNIEQTDDDVSPSVQFGYYDDRFFKEFEFLTTLGLSYGRTMNGVTSEEMRVVPVFELNMRPTTFFVVNTSFQPTYTYDLGDPDLSEFDPYLKLKGTLQF